MSEVKWVYRRIRGDFDREDGFRRRSFFRPRLLSSLGHPASMIAWQLASRESVRAAGSPVKIVDCPALTYQESQRAQWLRIRLRGFGVRETGHGFAGSVRVGAAAARILTVLCLTVTVDHFWPGGTPLDRSRTRDATFVCRHRNRERTVVELGGPQLPQWRQLPIRISWVPWASKIPMASWPLKQKYAGQRVDLHAGFDHRDRPSLKAILNFPIVFANRVFQSWI
jgi:hypothetical protein